MKVNICRRAGVLVFVSRGVTSRGQGESQVRVTWRLISRSRVERLGQIEESFGQMLVSRQTKIDMEDIDRRSLTT